MATLVGFVHVLGTSARDDVINIYVVVFGAIAVVLDAPLADRGQAR